MPKSLSEAAIETFRNEGYHSPVEVLSADEVARYGRKLAELEAREGGRLKGAVRNKSHLFLKWLHEIATHPKLLDAVEDLLGPDILLYHAQWFIKEPNTADFVSMHQDSAYWSLTDSEGLSAWIAFDLVDEDNGCMKVIPGTHKVLVEHEDRKSSTNMLWRGQTVVAAIDESKAVPMPLKPGEASLHHARIIHGSGSNRTSRRRTGYSLRYIPAWVGRTGPRDSAMLVRGEDKWGHFDLEPPPRADYEPAAIALHAEVNRKFMEFYTSARTEYAEKARAG